MKTLTYIFITILSIITDQYGAHKLDHANGSELVFFETSTPPPQLAACITTRRTIDTHERSLRSSYLPVFFELPGMSEVKNQLNIGACSVFAEIAIMEFLVTGVRFSEAELMIRAVTSGGVSRADRGASLFRFEPFIRAGLILEEKTVPYTAYNTYAVRRAQANIPDVLAISEDYKQSMEDIKKHCCPDIPTTEFLPKWETKDDYSFGECTTMITVEKPCGYWKGSHFNVFKVDTSNLTRLKQILQFIPIAVAVYDLIDRETGESWFDQPKGKKDLDAIIALNLSQELRFEKNGAHSICLCGYDDRIRAFKIKNSWGTHDSHGIPYGNNGYAYISYKAVQLYGNHAVTIVPNPNKQLPLEVLMTSEEKDPGILDKMLLEFAARRLEGQI